MRRKLRPAFLVTASSVGLACQKAPPPDYHINPPGTVTAEAPPPSAAPVSTIDPAPRLEDYPKLVNPTDADGRAIFSLSPKACYVELPYPPLKPNETREPGTPPPHKDVACPAAFADPAWAECAGGTIHAKDDRAACICFVMGNPPALPRRVACPKTR